MANFDLPPAGLPGPGEPGPDERTVGQRLAGRREECGWSQDGLSKATRDGSSGRVSRSRIAAIELGLAIPSRAEAAALAEKLDCSEIFLTHGVAAQSLEAVKMDLDAALSARVRGEYERACQIYQQTLTGESLIRYLPELYQDAVCGYAEALGQFGDQRTVDRLRALARGTVLGERSWGTVQAQLVAYHRRCGDLSGAIEAGKQALFSLMNRRARWGTAGVTIAIELLPVYVQAGEHTAADEVIDSLVNRVGAGRSPAIQFMTHVAIARAAAQMDRVNPIMDRAGASDVELLMHHANRAYELAMAFGIGHYHPEQLCRMANGHAQLLLTNERAGPARMALRVLSLDRLHWGGEQPATLAYRELYTAKAERVLGKPEQAAARLTARVLAHRPGWTSDLAGRALAERGNAYAALGRTDDGVRDLHGAAEHLDRAGLYDEASAATSAWHRLAASLPPPLAAGTSAARTSLPARPSEAIRRVTGAGRGGGPSGQAEAQGGGTGMDSSRVRRAGTPAKPPGHCERG